MAASKHYGPSRRKPVDISSGDLSEGREQAAPIACSRLSAMSFVGYILEPLID